MVGYIDMDEELASEENLANDAFRAGELFNQGYSCSQAVLTAHGEVLGIDPNLAVQIAGGFGGGMGRGETCGAVTAALMVLGLQNGGAGDMTAVQKATAAANRRFAKVFKERHGSLICKELLSRDVAKLKSQPGDFKSLRKARCRKLVEDACHILAEIQKND